MTASPGFPANSLQWVKKWQNLTILTLAGVPLAEIYYFNGNWYACAVYTDSEGHTCTETLGGPHGLREAAERLAIGHVKAVQASIDRGAPASI